MVLLYAMIKNIFNSALYMDHCVLLEKEYLNIIVVIILWLTFLTILS